MADTVTISRHIRTRALKSYMTMCAIKDVAAPDAPPPMVGANGRSPQTFVVDVAARKGRIERRAVARGEDIYAFTAPLVVEAVERIVEGTVATPGVFTAGEAFAARDFLEALSPAHLSFAIVESEKALVSA